MKVNGSKKPVHPGLGHVGIQVGYQPHNGATACDMMEELNISRGNVNMNIRELMDLGLVEKMHKSGDRKEYFWAEKDIWKITRQVAKERKKRELEPLSKCWSK